MIVSDIYNRVKRQFGDESGVQVTDTDLLRWINDGQRQIVMSNEGLLETTTTANTVADQAEYTLPTNLLLFKSVSYKGTGQVSYSQLRGMSFNAFQQHIDSWDGDTTEVGVPVVYTIYAGKIILYPIPEDSITNALKIYYTRRPTDVTASGDTPDLPILYHETLVKYCLQQAYEMDEDWEASTAKSTELAADLSLLRGREDWKQQDVYPTITVLTEDL